jgi:glycosyltransferase involved in cell wall biosynthesis
VDVSVVSSGHDVADARLLRTCDALTARGLAVEVLALGDPATGPGGTSVRSVGTRSGWSRRIRWAGTLPFRARGTVVVTLDPDLVPASLLRRAVRGGRVVVDVQEDYLALLADRSWARHGFGVAARLTARVATGLSRVADLTVVADDHVPPASARRRLVVRNLPTVGYLPPYTDPDPVPRALYIGDLRCSRGLFAMLDAIAAAPPWRLDLVGPVSAADRAKLEAWLATSPAADRVRLHGRLPPGAAWSRAAGAWAGLALLDDTPAFRAAVPSKLYEYLGCGLAVVTTPLPRMAALVDSSGAGVVVPDASAASDTLRRWRDRPEQLRDHRDAARRWADRHLGGPSPYDQLAGEVAALVTGSKER